MWRAHKIIGGEPLNPQLLLTLLLLLLLLLLHTRRLKITPKTTLLRHSHRPQSTRQIINAVISAGDTQKVIGSLLHVLLKTCKSIVHNL